MKDDRRKNFAAQHTCTRIIAALHELINMGLSRWRIARLLYRFIRRIG